MDHERALPHIHGTGTRAGTWTGSAEQPLTIFLSSLFATRAHVAHGANRSGPKRCLRVLMRRHFHADTRSTRQDGHGPGTNLCKSHQKSSPQAGERIQDEFIA